ncbi:MAG: hypothetical protein Kapaf2KO_09310 [Candidatus Kapaibacteriales bacterium]
MNEVQLQHKLKYYFSDPSKSYSLTSGKTIQLISIGEHNPHEGPDFTDAAIIADGQIIVGDIEYHINESDWFVHAHQNDNRYRKVILHIVSNLDSSKETLLPTLVINQDEITKAKSTSSSPILEETEDLQHFALIRMLRKASEAQILIDKHGFENAVIKQLELFIERYSSRRRRPVYSDKSLEELPKSIVSTKAGKFLDEVRSGKDIEIVDNLQDLVKKTLVGEGDHMRREILMNCILPLAIASAAKNSRIELLVWYWSAKSLTRYGVLNRKYPNHPQDYIWQQQGLLEYIRLYGNKKNVVSEVIRDYGFASVLDFYTFGTSYKPLID